MNRRENAAKERGSNYLEQSVDDDNGVEYEVHHVDENAWVQENMDYVLHLMS